MVSMNYRGCNSTSWERSKQLTRFTLALTVYIDVKLARATKGLSACWADGSSFKNDAQCEWHHRHDRDEKACKMDDQLIDKMEMILREGVNAEERDSR